MMQQTHPIRTRKKVLILGASGMLGHAVMRYLFRVGGFEVFGTIRSRGVPQQFPEALKAQVIVDVDVMAADALLKAFEVVRPDVVINCVGIVKQLPLASDPISALTINSLLPHRVAGLCRVAKARLIHISTDCVFSGARGMYREDDPADATDLYGRSKLLGEVVDDGNLTLRTSIIGPELNSAHGLIGWFLSQRGKVRGFRRAIFSGLPTVELARVIADVVIPNHGLHGLYHVSSEPITKLDLLALVAKIYELDIALEPDDTVVMDRSLSSQKFRQATGYVCASWPALIEDMHSFR